MNETTQQNRPWDCRFLTFNGDDVLPDLVLQGQVIDALDQVVDGVDVRVDGLEPVDLCSDGRRVGQNELRAGRTGLRSLARHGPRAELAGSRAGAGRAGSELGRDGLGHGDRDGRGDRARSGHGRLGLLREPGHWDARLEIHAGLYSVTGLLCRPKLHTLETRGGGWGGGSGEANKRSSRDVLGPGTRAAQTHQ